MRQSVHLSKTLLTSRRLSILAWLACLVVPVCACAARAPTQVVAEPAVSVPEPAGPVPEPGPLPAPEPSPQPQPVQAVVPDELPNCDLSGEAGDPVRLVGLTDVVDPAHAPYPSNEGERLVFRQLYETLVRVDCDGQVRPGLAASWRLDQDGRTWVVTLRENAVFTDATPVTAASVLSSWTDDAGAGELALRARRLVQAARLVDDRTLAIVLRNARTDAPITLAHTDLAVAKAVTGSPWPLGTRAARVGVDRAPGSLAGSVAIGLVRVSSNAAPPDAGPSLTFVVAPDRDRRDLLDEGVDMMVTRDPATLDYAATLPNLQLVPLAWRQTRVFVARGHAGTSLTGEQRQALAADAVRGEARGAEEPFWWQTLPVCDLTPPRQPAPLLQTTTRRVVYDGDDGAARDLAERLVALAGAPRADTASIVEALLPGRTNGAVRRVAGLTGNALAVARRRGNDAGYILTFDRAPLDPCADLQRVVESIEWLTPDAIVPLVDTRLQVILRHVHAYVTVEGDGGLFIQDATTETGR